MVEQQTHEELTAQQEDFLLEQAREEYFENKQAVKDELFDEWKTFNITRLKKDFEKEKENDDDFDEYCSEIFKFEYGEI